MSVPAPPRFVSGEILPSNEAGLARLVRLLAVKRGFQLFVLVCSDPQERDRLIARLREAPSLTGRQVLRVDLAEHGPSAAAPADVPALEARLQAEADTDAIVHLVNGDGWLQPTRIAELNLHRNALAAQVPASLLWWLPEVTVTELARGAPDVWSWRSAVVAFEGLAAAAGVAEFGSTSPPVAKDWLEVSRMSAGDKETRLVDLEQMLPQIKSPELRQGLSWELADILVERGRLDDALKVLQTQIMPTLSNGTREQALTWGRIADIFVTQGHLDEALRIRTEKELPVYEKLGDGHESAVTLGKIADILMVRGDLNEGLRVLSKEVLPAFEKQGDVRSRVVALSRIADILMVQGELDKALRIRTEEELPVYEKLGDIREKALTLGKIADILTARGELDEALRILNQEVLPALEKLGDVRSKAVTQGMIATILMTRGDLDEALRIRTEEELPVYEKLGDMRSQAVAHAKIGILLQRRKAPGDMAESRRLLDLALAEAHRLQLPQGISTIESWLQRLDDT